MTEKFIEYSIENAVSEPPTPEPIKPIDNTFPFYELESKSQAILEELLDIVDSEVNYGHRDSIMDLEDNLAIAMMLIQKYNDNGDVRCTYTRKAKNIHDEAEIKTHKRGGYVGGDVYERVVRVLTK